MYFISALWKQILSYRLIFLSFLSPQNDNGVRLATVTTGNEEWYLTVWDWEESIKLSVSEPYEDEMAELDIKFDPNDSNMLVTCGKEHLFFWDISQPDAIYQIGYFKDYQTPEYVTCLGFGLDGRLLSGDSNGVVHVWDTRLRRTISSITTTHTGSIITLYMLSGNYIMTGGGADRKLNLINYSEIMPTEAEFELPEALGGIVAMVPVFSGYNGGEKNFDFLRMVIGTSSNCILNGSISESFEVIVKGIGDVLPAVTINAADNVFISAGSDNLITAWSTETKADVWEIKQEYPCSAADFASNGSVVAIGTTVGRWFVYDSLDGSQLAFFQCDRSAVTCISFSPENDHVAIGMESGTVFFYKVINQVEYKYYVSSKVCDMFLYDIFLWFLHLKLNLILYTVL